MNQLVTDRPAEIGIKIGNILSGLLLAGVIGVWTSMEGIKDELASISKTVAVIQAEQELKFTAIEDRQRGRFKAYDVQYELLKEELHGHLKGHSR